MGDTSSVKQPVSGGSASVGNMRDDSLVVGLLSVKSCKAIRFHLLVVVMVLLSRFLIIVDAPMAGWSVRPSAALGDWFHPWETLKTISY
uniref:Uncharacterized protein n=1 Tax=Timema poppense TaxID=170557 RepID=A0A7R9DFL8_TIMPO|nr:unnamed protein product [Timema poppensis]